MTNKSFTINAEQTANNTYTIMAEHGQICAGMTARFDVDMVREYIKGSDYYDPMWICPVCAFADCNIPTLQNIIKLAEMIVLINPPHDVTGKYVDNMALMSDIERVARIIANIAVKYDVVCG